MLQNGRFFCYSLDSAATLLIDKEQIIEERPRQRAYLTKLSIFKANYFALDDLTICDLLWIVFEVLIFASMDVRTAGTNTHITRSL